MMKDCCDHYCRHPPMDDCLVDTLFFVLKWTHKQTDVDEQTALHGQHVEYEVQSDTCLPMSQILGLYDLVNIRSLQRGTSIGLVRLDGQPFEPLCTLILSI